MKQIIYFFLLILFPLWKCGNANLHMKVGRIGVMSASKKQLFFYRIVNGLSTNAFFLSQTSEICKGLKKEKDYYFLAMDQVIYYNVKLDTCFLYTRPLAIPPKNFGFYVVQKHISAFEDDQYEQMYQRKEINKVEIDSLYDPICDVHF